MRHFTFTDIVSDKYLKNLLSSLVEMNQEYTFPGFLLVWYKVLPVLKTAI